VNCVVQWEFRVAVGEEVVPQSITGFGTIATGRKRVNQKDREAEFLLEQGGVKIIGKMVVRKKTREGMHRNAGEQGEQGGEGKGLSMIRLLDGKEHRGGLVMGIDAALEPAQDCGLNKLFGGGFWGGGKKQVMGHDEQGEEVVIGTDEGGGGSVVDHKERGQL
jgi:hypothetical protein